jgi:hypothetical protein
MPARPARQASMRWAFAQARNTAAFSQDGEFGAQGPDRPAQGLSRHTAETLVSDAMENPVGSIAENALRGTEASSGPDV